MDTKINKTTLSLVRGDITKQSVETIVNAANGRLMGGGGVDGAIHRAGGPEILEECKEIIKKIGRLPTGKAVITTGGNLPAKYVIHTVGPIWRGGSSGEPELLKNAYVSSLKLAMEKEIKTIAFPSISTGAYRYPLKEAAKIAIKTVVDFLKENDRFDEVKFVLFTEKSYIAYKEALNSAKD
ncbi:MAG TPA: O-acetyl-ADP-ribose deacetylase [Actinobacteria bacterium]|nr:O-acetyl-ADP-ribose deacetylase [Actinomycetota bacterium]